LAKSEIGGRTRIPPFEGELGRRLGTGGLDGDNERLGGFDISGDFGDAIAGEDIGLGSGDLVEDRQLNTWVKRAAAAARYDLNCCGGVGC
jgi:hypothetical protein